MGREIEGLRDAVQDIRIKCPGVEMFGVSEVANLLNKSKHYVKDNLMPDTKILYITELARRLCMISRGMTIK